jgi:hypothetical protein
LEQKKEKPVTRELMSRVRRRATTLAQADYDRHVYAMIEALYAGSLKAGDIEAWRPEYETAADGV